ncbi:MAG TPA: hypothetical protein VGS08_02820 [Candidatus Saccharimonadales bacterium]|nr:hypothetical protein [Candidatus Saccharimonadales bacterium]
MFRYAWGLSGVGLLLFATFSTSPNYSLNSYSIGPGSTNSSASTTYKAQAGIGETATNKTSSTTKTGSAGGVQTEQLSVPLAPTLSNSNGGITFYNKLLVVLNDNAGSSNYPADVSFAIAIWANSIAGSPNYVQASGIVGSSPVYQTYTTWGGSSGSYITGLNPSTTYYVEVSAKQGLFTTTTLGASQSATTGSPTMTFSISPSSISMGSIVPGASPTISSNLIFNFATNSASGGSVYISGQNTGLNSPSQGHIIAAYSGNLATQSEGFGVQATNPTQTSGGPLSTVNPFNGTSNTVGAESTSEHQILTTAAAIVGGSANANLQAKSSISTPYSSDYSETLTFVAAGNF